MKTRNDLNLLGDGGGESVRGDSTDNRDTALSVGVLSQFGLLEREGEKKEREKRGGGGKGDLEDLFNLANGERGSDKVTGLKEGDIGSTGLSQEVHDSLSNLSRGSKQRPQFLLAQMLSKAARSRGGHSPKHLLHELRVLGLQSQPNLQLEVSRGLLFLQHPSAGKKRVRKRKGVGKGREKEKERERGKGSNLVLGVKSKVRSAATTTATKTNKQAKLFMLCDKRKKKKRKKKYRRD